MAENIVPGPQFERDVNKLEETVTQVAETRGINTENKDLVKESLKVASAASATVQSSRTSGKSSDDDILPSYLVKDAANAGAKEKVTALLTLAVQKDLFKALTLAKKAEPFVEDAFHDALVDHLVPELKRRGVLK